MSAKLVLPLAALVFCTWVVSLAGVASLQAKCSTGWTDQLGSINGFSSPFAGESIPCKRGFRFTWFVISLEFVLIIAAAAVAASGQLHKTRVALASLFTVATVLYIYLTDSYLTLDDMSNMYSSRVRTMVAGTIMTSTVNCFLLIALGTVTDEVKTVVKEAAAAAV